MEFAAKGGKKRGKETSNSTNSDQRRRSDGASRPPEEAEPEMGEDGLVFEDPYGDEFEEEEFDETAENDREEGDDEEKNEEDETADMQVDQQQPAKQLWRPNVDQLPEGEELEYDPSAYIMYHSLRTEWPCLSFDIFRDDLGENRHRFPLTMYVASGSQADRPDRNKVTLLKLSDLHRTQQNADSDGESDDDENLDEDPTIEHANIPHQGGVNRIRCMPQTPGVLATMADTKQVHIFDASTALRSMMAVGPRVVPPTKPVFSFRGHREEGFGIDWSPVVAGRMATGDCSGAIHIWNTAASTAASNWQVDPVAYRGHEGSVEDLQWSPTEGTVFVSASSDKTIRVWDVRAKTSQISIQAHSEDVNVVSWNKSVSYLLASGSDDGSFKVWDLRTVRNSTSPLAHFKYHTAPITSIEWAPHDESVLCASSSDNQVTIWDLSVEADEEASGSGADPALADFPPQLLFIHQGQSNVKEIHHHPQIPGVIMTTAEDGFNIFKPAITVS